MGGSVVFCAVIFSADFLYGLLWDRNGAEPEHVKQQNNGSAAADLCAGAGDTGRRYFYGYPHGTGFGYEDCETEKRQRGEIDI